MNPHFMLNHFNELLMQEVNNRMPQSKSVFFSLLLLSPAVCHILPPLSHHGVGNDILLFWDSKKRYIYIYLLWFSHFPYRWGIAFPWSFGGSAVSETPLWTATSDKADLAGLPPRSPPLPTEVCGVELQLHHSFFLFSCLLPFSFQGHTHTVEIKPAAGSE